MQAKHTNGELQTDPRGPHGPFTARATFQQKVIAARRQETTLLCVTKTVIFRPATTVATCLKRCTRSPSCHGAVLFSRSSSCQKAVVFATTSVHTAKLSSAHVAGHLDTPLLLGVIWVLSPMQPS